MIYEEKKTEKKTQVNYSPEILRFIINNCNINLDDIQNDMEQMERKELLEKHPYKIWEGKDGEWYTNVFCKPFLDKIAKYFWTLLQVHFGQSCKALASLK